MNDSTTNKSCLSLESEAIQPDMRVAYTKGLVLGVDEFVQEQRYFLEKDYLHNRGLHGYGTVYGLNLGIAKSESGDPEREEPPPPEEGDPEFPSPPPEPPIATSVEFDNDEVTWVKVSAGVGVDQRGRTFVLQETFCINLKGWLQKDGKIPANLEGIQSIYIRARYDETCSNPMALAGQPCTSEAVESADTRIKDGVVLELSPEIPIMSAWDFARRFAWLISQIRIVPSLEDEDSDDGPILINYVRQWLTHPEHKAVYDALIADQVAAGKPAYFQLLQGSQTLDALRLAYLTEVVPQSHKTANPYDAPTTEAENDVLLGQLNVEITVPTTGDPYISKVTINQDERPYLLGTQVFQELSSLGSRDKHRRSLFASLHVESSQSLLLWMHHDLDLPDALEDGKVILKSNGSAVKGAITEVAGASGVFRIETKTQIPARAQVEMIFYLAELVEEESTDLSIFNSFVGLNEDGTSISIYAFADNLPGVRSLALVSAQRQAKKADPITLDIWFNTTEAVTENGTAALQIVKNGAAVTGVTVTQNTANTRLWHAKLPTSIKDKDLLILRLDVWKINVGTQLLERTMNAGQYTFVGYDGVQFIDLLYAVDVPTTFTQTEITTIINEQIDDVVPDLITEQINQFKLSELDSLRILPFATITPQLDGSELSFEVWLHTSLISNAYAVESALTAANLLIFAEQGAAFAPITFTATPDPTYNNVTRIVPAQQQGDLNYLRFVFLPGKIHLSAQKTLQDVINDENVKFEGYFVSAPGETSAIVVYVRNLLKPPSPPSVLNDAVNAAPKNTPKTRTRRGGGKG